MVSERMTKEQNDIFIVCLSTVAILGLSGNIIFVSTIFCRALESKFTNYLLRSQSLIDSVVCIVTIIIVIFPDPMTSGNVNVDSVFCHIWTSQAIFWWTVLASIYNLIFLAVDRYSAVIIPQSYKNKIKKKIFFAYSIIFGCTGLSVIPAFFQYTFQNGTCLTQMDFVGESAKFAFKSFSIYWFIAVYGFPAPLLIFLYSKIIWKLYESFKRDKRISMQASMKSFTKSTLINTIIFLITIAYDAMYYMLGYLGVVEYVLYSPTQRVGVFLTSVNSSTNPLVFFILVKSFRRKFLMVWCKKCVRKSSNKVENNNMGKHSST